MANQNLPPEPDDHQLSSLARHIRPIFGEYYGYPVDAAVRELAEETSIQLRERIAAGKCTELVQVGAWDAPGRDPRGRVVSVVYTAVLLGQRPEPVAADDAAAAEWVRVDDLLAEPDKLAFDHATILCDAIAVIRRVTPLGA